MVTHAAGIVASPTGSIPMRSSGRRVVDGPGDWPGAVAQALRDAWSEVRRRLPGGAQDEPAEPVVGSPRTVPFRWGQPPDGVGICLSGGGIRSASYCLGALQSLGKHGLLFGGPGRAKYLTSVSGGSYIATALTMVTKGPIPKGQPP